MNLFSYRSELNIEFWAFDYISYEGDEHPTIGMELKFSNGYSEFNYKRAIYVDWV